MTFCSVCGQRLAEVTTFDHFDVETGARVHSVRLVCPNYRRSWFGGGNGHANTWDRYWHEKRRETP